MAGAARLGDLNTGHDNCPATALTSGSLDVFINGKPAARVGDTFAPHGCKDHPSHVGTIVSGAPYVFINGRHAARVGDSVSCGGTIAEGSPNVFIGDKGGAALGDQIGADALKTSYVPRLNNPLVTGLNASDTETYKTILYLPDIAREEADRADTDADKQGWTYLAMMFDRWLAGKASTDQSGEPFEIDFGWLEQYEPVRDALTKLNGLVRNKNCQAEIINSLKKAGKLHAGDFDFTKIDRADWETYYVTHADLSHNKIKIVTGKTVYDADQNIGLAACLGDFDIRALPKGTISTNADGSLKISIKGFSVYVRDSFNFEDDQPLGYWSYKDKKFVNTTGQLILESNKTFLWNSSFRSFRKRFNHGQDFLVYSNLKDIPDFEPFEFTYKD